MTVSGVRRRLLAPLAVALALLVGMGPSSAHVFEARTRITLHRVKRTFYGKVSSPKPGCRRHRTIKVYRFYKGEKKFMGSEASRRDGSWEMLIFRRPPGHYHAIAPRKFRAGYGHIHRCKRAESGSIYVPPR